MMNSKAHGLMLCLLTTTVATVFGGFVRVAMAQQPPATAKAKPAVKAKPAELPFKTVPPVIVKTVPEAGAVDVDPELKEIHATFSKPMTDRSWSWATDERFGEVIEGEKPSYDKDGKTCRRSVKLKAGTTYAVWLNTEKFDNFKDADGNPAVPYLLVFRTADAKHK